MQKELDIPTLNIDIYRVIYCLLLLCVFPHYVDPRVGEIPSSLLAMPVGFDFFITRMPSGNTINFLEYLRALFLVLLLFKQLPRVSSLSCFAIWVLLHGIEFGTGKIDHHLIVATPLLWYGLVGWKESRLTSYLIVFSIASFFFSAGLIKIISGWLTSEQSALGGILQYYSAVYGVDSPLKRFPSDLLGLLDIGAICFELSFILLFFQPRYITYYIFTALVFHLGIKYSLGIDFFKLFSVYLLFLPINHYRFRAKDRKYLWPLTAAIAITPIIVAMTFTTWPINNFYKITTLTNRNFSLYMIILWLILFCGLKLLMQSRKTSPSAPGNRHDDLEGT